MEYLLVRFQESVPPDALPPWAIIGVAVIVIYAVLWIAFRVLRAVGDRSYRWLPIVAEVDGAGELGLSAARRASLVLFATVPIAALALLLRLDLAHGLAAGVTDGSYIVGGLFLLAGIGDAAQRNKRGLREDLDRAIRRAMESSGKPDLS